MRCTPRHTPQRWRRTTDCVKADHTTVCTPPSDRASRTSRACVCLQVQLRGDDDSTGGGGAEDAAETGGSELTLPPFLSVVREVTDEPSLSCHQLSLK